LSTGLSPVNKILPNFNLYIFKPPQPIFDHFLTALASSSHCYYFYCDNIFLIFFVFYYFLCGDPKIDYNKPNEFCTMNPKIIRDILVFQREEKVKEFIF